MVKMRVSVDIEVETLSRTELNELRTQIEYAITDREVMLTDTPKFRATYYMGLIERFGKHRAMMRYHDDTKCTLTEAKNYISRFTACQTCHKFGGYVRMYNLNNIRNSEWVCPHCGIPPLPENATKVENAIP